METRVGNDHSWARHRRPCRA